MGTQPRFWSPQELAQSDKTTLNEMEVTSSNPPSPSCADMPKKKKKKKTSILEYRQGSIGINKSIEIMIKYTRISAEEIIVEKRGIGAWGTRIGT
jgi:hypothetical protein